MASLTIAQIYSIFLATLSDRSCDISVTPRDTLATPCDTLVTHCDTYLTYGDTMLTCLTIPTRLSVPSVRLSGVVRDIALGWVLERI